MKKFVTLILIFVVSLQFVKADEGMWLLTMLNKTYPQMKAEGFKLTPEDVYSINKASLKDAVVIFGGFCTGEIVSDKGLVFTNHHCGFGSIQSHSTADHDYLTNGFWSQSMSEELPNPGLYVKFLVKLEDVTQQVLKGVKDDMTEDKRNEIIKKNSEKIEKKALKGYAKDEGYEAHVRSFFHNNQYFLIIYQKYSDVRLVGTPPSSIGKFGGDTDNWMWTRHTGDFSIFRVYMSPDGKPAEYSPNNVPLKPKYVMPVSIAGYKKGDYAQIMGYPGRTERYAPSYAVREIMNIVNTDRAKIRGIRQDILWKDMMNDHDIYIKYASKYAISSNYWKYSIGQNQGLKRLKVIKRKQEIENQFAKWIAEDPKRQATYKDVLPTFKQVITNRAGDMNALIYLSECFRRGTEYVAFAHKATDLYDALKSGKTDDIKNATDKLKAEADKFFKDYSPSTDKKASTAMLKLFVSDIIQSQYLPDFLSDAKKNFPDLDAYVADIFKRSIFVSQDKFNKFIANPSLDALENDPAFVEASSIYTKYNEVRDKVRKSNEKLERAYRLWMRGLMEMYPNKTFYPDANFTMRYTYGTIGGYSPKDAVYYNYFTTLKGVMEKEDPNNPDFIVPKKLKELYQKKDYGQYADKDGTMHVCFLSNNDITGGNSGSPVLNANGQLIGLAFDGNWEAMSGDIAFEPNLQRTIIVDVRYVLFIIDKYGNCPRLIDELNIVK